MWSQIGELLFTVVVSYMGAIELLFVARQLYHLAFQHQRRQVLSSDEEFLKRLQDQIDNEILEADRKEVLGFNTMKDGVLYKDGFRIDPNDLNGHEKSQRMLIGSSKTSLEKINQENSEQIVTETSVSNTETNNRNEELIEVCEEPCIKKNFDRLTSRHTEAETSEIADDKRTNISQTIRTQIGQTNVSEYPSVTDNHHKIQSTSPKRTEEVIRSASVPIESNLSKDFSPLSPELYFDGYEREEPDGQDVPEPQFSDDYLRSLDGIKIRPLVRDDGSGRRRAFKKRRSSDSTSSRESRVSREEELKMFTSLEEEEFESIRRGDSDYIPIRYSSDPNLKGGKHQRRHKKSPVKDSLYQEKEENRSSLEKLNEENDNPWGDIKPEHYKDLEFWKKEKTISIEEENEEPAQSWSASIHGEQAGELMTSVSPIKNIPKLSSFEEASPSQHEDLVPNLNRKKSEEKDKKSTKTEDVENVSNDPNLKAETILAFSDNKTSDETEIISACNKPDDMKTENKGLRKSPRLDDLDCYEDHISKEENAKQRALSPSLRKSPNNKNLSISQLTENQPEITPAYSTDDQTFLTKTSNNEEISSSLGENYTRGVSPRTCDRPKTPEISIDLISDINTLNKGPSDQIKIISESGLLEGISDFYDFNASINPSRSPSAEKYIHRSPSPLNSSKISSINFSKTSNKDFSNNMKPINLMPGLSDFYDFCVVMNEISSNTDRAIHRSSTDYFANKLQASRSKSRSPNLALNISKNDFTSLPEEGGGTSSSEINVSPSSTTTTPEYNRTLSANFKYVESIRDDLRNNMYKRSRYVGESMDFDNDFEYLREQTRHFNRSRSQSRSPIPDDNENDANDDSQPSTSKQANLTANRRELQDKILEEITRTTINYQDFSRDFSKPYMDFDRRVSDSALIQKPELMIHIDEDYKTKNSIDNYDDDDINNLDPDEYHHFRRFSLNFEQPIEEYPNTNEYVYMEEIDVQTKRGIRNWSRKDYSDPGPEIIDISKEDSDHVEPDDNDSESEDDRQTVVEVDDEIDEDIWDYERPEESNDQSECEEAEREMDRYANKSAQDWYEDGAVGGIDSNFDTQNIDIDQMYDDAIQNTEESGIEKDYDTIVKSMKHESESILYDTTEINNSLIVKTEDLLDEILNEDRKRYNCCSPSKDKIEKTRNFIEHEINSTSSSSQRKVSPSSISSTRLRSRYGIAPANLHRDYDDLENITVDLNYKPKKEYKWRKNFKIDDDDIDGDGNGVSDSQKLTSQILDSEDESNQSENAFECDENSSNKNDAMLEKNETDLLTSQNAPISELQDESFTIRKGSEEEASAEAIPIYKSNENDMETRTTVENISLAEIHPTKINEESEVVVKKRKIKRKTRKGSKGSIGEEEAIQSFQLHSIDENNKIKMDTEIKKKPKKKKKSVDITASDTQTQLTTLESSTTINTETIDFTPQIKSKSSSPLPQSSPLSSSSSSTSRLENQSINSENAESIPSPSSASSTTHLTSKILETKSKSKSPESVNNVGSKIESKGTSSTKPQLERNDSSGVYELIKDGSMYPWF